MNHACKLKTPHQRSLRGALAAVGSAPAPIFSERVKTLSILHPSLPQPRSPGRQQADISLGRLVLQDMPEHNLLMEAYAAKN